MEYAILIYRDEAETGVDWERREADYAEYFTELGKAGVMRGGPRVDDSGTASVVRVRNGQRKVTNGPFHSGADQLSGVFVIECASRDEATDWTARCPGAEHGAIEIREVVPS
jgi:hypothetical protein